MVIELDKSSKKDGVLTVIAGFAPKLSPSVRAELPVTYKLLDERVVELNDDNIKNTIKN